MVVGQFGVNEIIYPFSWSSIYDLSARALLCFVS